MSVILSRAHHQNLNPLGDDESRLSLELLLGTFQAVDKQNKGLMNVPTMF
jgi:hypothetical protein